MALQIKRMGLIASALLILTGCMPGNSKDQPNKEDKTVPVKTTSSQLSDDYYRAVIVDGHYKLGPSATGDASITPSEDHRAFENGLLRISKEVFPTNQYYMQEGQILDKGTLTKWLEREAEDNPEGLNPQIPKEVAERLKQTQPGEQDQQNESQESGSQVESQSESHQAGQVNMASDIPPIYLSQVIEKDLMTESDKGFSLSGIVIGLAMNSEYVYTDRNGVEYKHEISVGEMRERGRQYANIIVGRIRQTEELRKVPIVVGIYNKSHGDSPVPGTFVLDGISREGNAINDWKEHNEYRVQLPIVGNDNRGDEYVYFDNFKNEIQNFFPNLNGISGDALYIDNGLATLNIEIVTQFYQKTEIVALTQRVLDVAKRQLPEGVSVSIKITSAAGNEAVITRHGGSGQFNTMIVN